MFQLVSISDTVRIEPHLIPRPSDDKSTSASVYDSVLLVLNKKYANKVIEESNLGLAILVFDIISMREPKIQPGDGATFILVEFRLIVFNPFIGEVLEGVIRSSTPSGIIGKKK